MRDRLLKFMEAEHLQASRLAEILGVQPATISHILNGRVYRKTVATISQDESRLAYSGQRQSLPLRTAKSSRRP